MQLRWGLVWNTVCLHLHQSPQRFHPTSSCCSSNGSGREKLTGLQLKWRYSSGKDIQRQYCADLVATAASIKEKESVCVCVCVCVYEGLTVWSNLWNARLDNVSFRSAKHVIYFSLCVATGRK